MGLGDLILEAIDYFVALFPSDIIFHSYFGGCTIRGTKGGKVKEMRCDERWRYH